MNIKQMLEERIRNFWGYGNLDSNIWFVGMEEGFGGSEQELEKRIINTCDKSVVDIQSGMSEVTDHLKWFNPNSSLQKTWWRLIHILITIEGHCITSNEQIKDYQRKNWCRSNSNHCCIELMPLACRSIKQSDWIYSKYDIDNLANRTVFKNKIMPQRVAQLRKMINEKKPTTVICYSTQYMKEWMGIFGNDFVSITDKVLHKFDETDRNIFIIPHSNAHGLKNSDWETISNAIKEKIKK